MPRSGPFGAIDLKALRLAETDAKEETFFLVGIKNAQLFEIMVDTTLLLQTGFMYYASRSAWISLSRRQVFSDAIIAEESDDWLAEKLSQAVPDGECWFFGRFDARSCFEIRRELWAEDLRHWLKR